MRNKSFKILLSCAAVLILSENAMGQSCPSGEMSLQFQQKFASSADAGRAAKRLLTRDRDGDGLPDCVELALALNPNRSDSLADGTEDGERLIDVSHTALELYSAGKFDSDGDGFSDAEEVQNGGDVYLVDGSAGVSVRVAALQNAAVPVATPTIVPNPSVQAAKKCKKKPTTVSARHARLGSSLVSARALKKCRKPVKKTPTPSPSASKSPTPKPTTTGSASPTPSKSPTPSASKTPTPTPAKTPTPSSSGGNAANGKSYFSSRCQGCHGKQSGRSESQVRAAMNLGVHAGVKLGLNDQLYADIAAYLQSSL